MTISVSSFSNFIISPSNKILLIVFCEDLVYLIYAEDGMLKSEISVESQKLFEAISFSFVVQPLFKRNFQILMRKNGYLIERMKRWYM